MPAFKFNYFDPAFDYAALVFEHIVVLDFIVEHSSDLASFEFHIAPPSVDFFAVEIPSIELPPIDAYFFAQSADSDSASVQINLAPVGVSFVVAEAPDVTASFLVSIKPSVSLFSELESLHPVSIDIDVLIKPFFETYVPVLADIEFPASVLMLNFELYHPTYASMKSSLFGLLPSFSALSVEQNAVNFSLGLPQISLTVHSDIIEAQFAFSATLVRFAAICATQSSDDESEIIRFDYQHWMFENLKSIMPYYSDTEIIKHIEETTSGGS